MVDSPALLKYFTKSFISHLVTSLKMHFFQDLEHYLLILFLSIADPPLRKSK